MKVAKLGAFEVELKWEDNRTYGKHLGGGLFLSNKKD